MTIVKVGLSHHTAPVEIRERLALRAEELPSAIDDLLQNAPIAEAAVLSTCNRFEVYAALPRDIAPDAQRLDEAARAISSRLARRGGTGVEKALVRRHGFDAVRHLFRVACSLDSIVVGEPQILGQLKDAMSVAIRHGSVGPMLSRALHRALHVGKRVRTETQIGQGQVSVSSVAVDLAGQIFGDLSGRVAVLVGAGEMAEAAARLLGKQGARLVVVNRSRERADRLAAEVGGEPRDWGELNWCLIDADIVITSTSSPSYVVTLDAQKTVRKARRGRSLFFIDIAVPRNVDPAIAKLDGVYLYDIDNLEQAVAGTLAGRAAEAGRAETMVEEELSSYQTKWTELALNPVVVGLRARVRATLVSELERSLSGRLKHLSQAERDALGLMLDAATNKLCHRPTTRLRALAQDPRADDYVEMMRDLFDLPDTIGASDDEPAEATPAPALAERPDTRSS